jgi:hypothetical protein
VAVTLLPIQDILTGTKTAERSLATCWDGRES